MSIVVHNVTVDCRDPFGLATWWASLTGGKVADGDQPGDDERPVGEDGGVRLELPRYGARWYRLRRPGQRIAP